MHFDYVHEVEHKKAEINAAIERYHGTITFMITTVIAVLSFGVSAYSPVITYFSMIANYLLWKKSTFYKNVMAQHSAYCQVFLENEESGFHWESINQAVSDNETQNKTVNSYIEFEAIGMNLMAETITALLIVFADLPFAQWSVKQFASQFVQMNWIQFAFLLLSLLTFVISAVKIIKSPSVHRLRIGWVQKFEEIKRQSDSVKAG